MTCGAQSASSSATIPNDRDLSKRTRGFILYGRDPSTLDYDGIIRANLIIQIISLLAQSPGLSPNGFCII